MSTYPIFIMSVSVMKKHLSSLKFEAKDLVRNAKRCTKEEKVERAKLRKALQNYDMEGADIHAENVLRQKDQAQTYLIMASRVDAVASRVQTALTTKKGTTSTAGVVESMEAAMMSMNLEKICALMDAFEKHFEDLDVQSSHVENAMSSTTTVPQKDVERLTQRAADEAGIC